MSERATTRHDDETATAGDPREKPSSGPVLFLPLLALFVFGLWLMGYGYEQANGVLFGAGLLVCGFSFAIPQHLLRD